MNEKDFTNRKELIFLILASTFIGAMAILNVVGITKFIKLGPLALAVGVLPYPITFLCTDLISELYGKKKASQVVWTGLFINIFIFLIMYIGNLAQSVDLQLMPPWQSLSLEKSIYLPNGQNVDGEIELFHIIYACTSGSVLASMIAYLAAQFCDVYLFHFWKDLTKGKHLWLRNNGSTMVSQLIDSIAVISITFGLAFLRGEMTFNQMLNLLLSNYSFKFLAALIDTLPFYIGVKYLSRYIGDSDKL